MLKLVCGSHCNIKIAYVLGERTPARTVLQRIPKQPSLTNKKAFTSHFLTIHPAKDVSLVLEFHETCDTKEDGAMQEASQILKNFKGITYDEFTHYVKSHLSCNDLGQSNMKFLFRALIFQEPSWAQQFYNDFQFNITESHLAKYELYLHYELKNFSKIENEIVPKYLQTLSENNETMNAVTLYKILVSIISNQKNIDQIPSFIKSLISQKKLMVYSMMPTKIIQLLIKNSFQTRVIENVFSSFANSGKFPISNNLIILLLEYYAKITNDVTQTSFYQCYYPKLSKTDKQIFHVYLLIHEKFNNQTNMLIHKENDALKVNQILKENTFQLYKSIQEILINLNLQNTSVPHSDDIRKTKSLFLIKLLNSLAHKSYYRDMIKIMKILKAENLLDQNKAKVNESISFYFSITEQFPGLLKYFSTTTTNNKHEFKNISKSSIKYLILSFKKSYPELINQFIENLEASQANFVGLKNKEFANWIMSILNKSEEPESHDNSNIEQNLSNFVSKGLNPIRKDLFYLYRKALITNDSLTSRKVMEIIKDCNLSVSPAFKIFDLKYQLYQYLLKCEELGKLQLFGIDEKKNLILSMNNYNIVFQNSTIKFFNDKAKEDCEYIMKKMIQNFIKEKFDKLTFNSFIELGYIASALKLNDYSNRLLVTCESVIASHSNHDANNKDPILKDLNIMINRSEIDRCYLGLLNNHKLLRNYDAFNNVLDKILNNHEYKLTTGLISKINTQFKHFLKLERSEILKLCNVEINVYSHNDFSTDYKSHEIVPMINLLISVEKFSEILSLKYKNDWTTIKRETEHYRNILLFAKEFERLFINIKLRFNDQSMFFDLCINQSLELINDWYEYAAQKKLPEK